jgi:hypothetical protein
MTLTADQSAGGTELAPRFYEGPQDSIDDVHMHQRYYTYQTDAGLVAGKTASMMFTIDRPVHEVWPIFKDFNRWQGVYEHAYSGVVGDLEGQILRLALGSGPFSGRELTYVVQRVIPEHSIVLYQPIPDGEEISPGSHVFMLNNHGGRTVVTCITQHASLHPAGTTDDEALQTWRELAPDSQMKWIEIFIPKLKKLVYEG